MNLGEPLRAQKKQQHFKKCCCFFCGSRRAIRSITFAVRSAPLGGSATIPLASWRKRTYLHLNYFIAPKARKREGYVGLPTKGRQYQAQGIALRAGMSDSEPEVARREAA